MCEPRKELSFAGRGESAASWTNYGLPLVTMDSIPLVASAVSCAERLKALMKAEAERTERRAVDALSDALAELETFINAGARVGDEHAQYERPKRVRAPAHSECGR